MTTYDTAITVSGLKKRFQDKDVLKGIDFSVARGTIYTLLGSNGAGKTTTIRILTTLLTADSGTITIAGYDVKKQPQEIHASISLTGQFTALDDSLTGRENLILMGRLYHLPSPRQKAEELLSSFGLSDAADKAVSTYSGGMKRRLDIAMSLAGNPQIIFLDEPTTGLDPQSRRSMWNMICGLRHLGVTVFLTTQYLEEAEQLSDMIAILDQGRIIAQGTPDELKAYLPQGIMRLSFQNGKDLEQAKSLLQDYRIHVVQDKHAASEIADCSKEYEFLSIHETTAGYQSFAKKEQRSKQFELSVVTDGKADTLAKILSMLYQNQVSIQEFERVTPDLEDVFLTMIQ